MEEMQNWDAITLIGMPGAGKSTLGVVLAKRLGMSFVDTDLLIQRQKGCILADIIARNGVDAFKTLEERVILQGAYDRSVIATGGSAVYGHEAMRYLHGLGPVVYIQVGLDALTRRLGDNLAARGVAAAPDTSLETIYKDRAGLYRQYADITVETDGLEVYEAVDALVDALKSWEAR